VPLGPKPSVLGLVRIDFNQLMNSQAVKNSIHVVKLAAAVWTGAELTQILTLAREAWNDNVQPLQNASLVLTNVEATDLSSSMGLTATQVSGLAGSVTATAANPLNCCIRQTTRVPLRVRGGRFGLAISGTSQGDLLDQRLFLTTVVTAFLVGLAETYGALDVTLSSGAVVEPCEVSYQYAGVYRTPPIVMPQLTWGGIEVQQRISSRRRRLGRGIAGE
jgi:hypothetical protein